MLIFSNWSSRLLLHQKRDATQIPQFENNVKVTIGLVKTGACLTDILDAEKLGIILFNCTLDEVSLHFSRF